MNPSEDPALMLNTPYEGIIFIDNDGYIRFANTAFKTYTGLTDADLLHTHLSQHNLDPGLLETIQTGDPDLLSYYPEARLLASRQPVITDGKIIGALGRYVALDTYALKQKLWDREDFLKIVSRIRIKDIMMQTSRLFTELNAYRDDFKRSNIAVTGIEAIIGSSQKYLKEMILRLASSPSAVLITGESGVGKELYAHAIHFHSDRSQEPFVKVNCAAIPENLLESELFGYVDGAFTGARKGGKMGKFELANQGTIFLDEIGDMPWSMQAKLLRVLQEKEIERVGDNKTRPVDVRIISATNADLEHLVAINKFRHDLYYRLNVVKLYIPPLRERKQDIIPLAMYFIGKLNTKLGQNVHGISDEVKRLLTEYNWPGNIRELNNVLEMAMNFCQNPEITPEDLPLHIRKSSYQTTNYHEALLQAERRIILQTLDVVGKNREDAAQRLGISRATLFRLLKKHNLIHYQGKP
ncbi:MAG: sigma 54-interacting transcriptional regulator [Syntrophomonadaceae bacterium]|jgi:transcriptional regulator with PAS, ATPase and Fis domain|nr:sigma 54-interacting transcriptional regulator [Syntrophomonadaceae bacterium]